MFDFLLSTDPSSTTDILGSIIVLLGSIFGFIKWVLPFIYNIKKNNNEKSIIKEREKCSQIYDLLHRIEKETTAERIIVFNSHNCGGFPVVGKPYFTSGIFHVDTPKLKSIDLNSYKNIEVDEAYNSMILKIYKNDHILLKTSQMQDCQLRDYYKVEGVSESLIVYLGVKGNDLFYISIAKYDGLFKNEEITKINLYANQIKHLLI